MLCSILLALAPPPQTAPAPRYVSVPLTLPGSDGDQVVRTTCGSPAKNYILEVNGGGLLLGDFDADGAHDLVVVDGSTIERARAGEAGLPPRLSFL